MKATELKTFVECNPKLVQRKESKRWPGLYVLKYKKDVFYDNLWHLNDALLDCRGLVVDENYNVVVQPFRKVFNYQENGTVIDLNEECDVVRKVNGFLGVATYDSSISHGLIYSTTGSLDSDFVDLIEKHVHKYLLEILDWCDGDKATFLFEICDSSDPHIIPEEEGAWLIGCNMYDKGWMCEYELDAMADLFGCKRPEHLMVSKFKHVLEMSETAKHEGFMVEGMASGTKLKLKTPYYLTSKFFARASEKKMTQIISSPQAREEIDEEYYPLIDYVQQQYEQYKELDEQAKLAFIREFLSRNNDGKCLVHQ